MQQRHLNLSLSRRALTAVIGASALLGSGMAMAETTLERIQKQGYIRVGFANEAPYAFATPDGKLSGESPTVFRHVMKQLGVNEVDGVLTEWGALIPGLKAGRFDAIVASMYITPKRCEQVLFANPTYGIGEAFVVKKGNPDNINADPLFTDTFDYRLLEGSPSIDTGGSGPALDTDLNGAQRALDGDGDGVAVADQGAFEFSLPAPPPPDTTGPRISGVKFRAPREGARILKISVDEAGRVTAVFKPLPKRSRGRKRKTLKLSESFSSPGFTKFIIPRSQLKKGKYRLFVTAVDNSGNKASKPGRIVRVKR